MNTMSIVMDNHQAAEYAQSLVQRIAYGNLRLVMLGQQPDSVEIHIHDLALLKTCRLNCLGRLDLVEVVENGPVLVGGLYLIAVSSAIPGRPTVLANPPEPVRVLQHVIAVRDKFCLTHNEPPHTIRVHPAYWNVICTEPTIWNFLDNDTSDPMILGMRVKLDSTLKSITTIVPHGEKLN
jgi:hypothetical protein